MCWMLKSVRDVLKNDFGIENVLATKKLMGVWKDKRKLASIGMGMSRFVTEHGLALNIEIDSKMKQSLQKIFPCGLQATTYNSVSEYVENTEGLLNSFHESFIKFLESEYA
jgi:lipoyl(octanoyl) transferase